MYDFRKLYADVVAPDGTVCIVYQTWVHLFGAWHARGGVELCAPDGRRVTRIGEAAATPPEPDASIERVPIRLTLGGESFEVSVEEQHGGFDPGPACDALAWSVKLGAGRVRARGAGIDLEGRGYVDWVRITRATRRLGLRELAWGRAHVGPGTLVWTALDFADGRRWNAGAAWGERGRDTGGVRVDLDARGSGDVTVADHRIHVEPGRVLYEGDAFAPERIPGLVDRLVTRAVGGATYQSRWMGRARGASGEGDALYERVRFGR